jgi:hypothetical protein
MQQQPPQGYPQQGPAQGYAQPPAAGYQQPQQAAFSFADVYNQADASGGLIPDDWYPSLVEKSEFGRTSKGDKWAWTIVFRIASGQPTGRQLTTTMALSPMTNDGQPNPGGMSRTFRQLHALGVPVGDKFGGQPGEQPFFAQFPVPQGAPPEVANAAIKAAGDYAAQLMTGRPVRIKVYVDPDWNNNKIKDIAPSRPGDPTVMPQQAQQAGPQYGPSGFAPPAQPGGPAPYSPQAAQQGGYAQPGPQPVGPGGQPPWQGQPQQGYPPQQFQGQPGMAGPPAAGAPAAPVPPGAPVGPQAPAPYGQQAPQPGYQGDMAAGPGSPPAAPDPAGQPGVGQFTPQGQAPQQPPWQGQPNGAPPQQAAPQQGAPPPPPWAQ